MSRHACEMAFDKCLFTLFLLVGVTVLTASENRSDRPPIITSTNVTEVILRPEGDYVIRCEGDTSLDWSYPNISGTEPEITGTQENGKYISSLMLKNISYKDVGDYKCLLANKPDIYSRIYLFVEDAENLLTYSDLFFVPVHGIQYQDIVIPCKPTHPKIEVSLCRNADEKLHIGDNDDNGIIRYDHKVGFILENAQINRNGYYYCCILSGDTCKFEECPRTYSLEVLKHADSVARPAIDDAHLQHVTVGDNVTIDCKVTVPASTKFNLKWEIPNQTERIKPGKEDTSMPKDQMTTGRNTLTILNVKLEDAGNYTCKVKDHANNTNSETIYLKIYGRNEAYINLSVTGNKTDAEVLEGKEQKWVVNVDAHPQATFTWYHGDAKIENLPRIFHTTNNYGKESVLVIKNVNISDRGNYTLQATNGNATKELTLRLVVSGKPYVFMPQYPVNILAETTEHVNCTIIGKPIPNVTWFFKPNMKEKTKIPIFRNYVENETIVSEVQINTTSSGILECFAKNLYGSDSETTQIIVTDVEGGIEIQQESEEIVEGYVAKLKCLVSKDIFTNDIKWFKQGEEINELYNNTSRFLIERGETIYSYQTQLVIKNVKKSDEGEYKCEGFERNTGTRRPAFKDVTVKSISSPQFSKDTNMNGGEHLLDAMSQYSLNCKPSGVPKPRLIWLKDGKPLKPNDTSVEFMHNNTTVVIKNFKAEHAGVYTCTAVNPINEKDRKSVTATLKFKDVGGTDVGLIAAVIVSILFIAICVILGFKINRDRQIRKEQRIAGLDHFTEGAMDNMNPDLPVDEQAELLPYDKKWEFPREKLKLGKQLGSGAFGVVMKAEAFGITQEEPITVVAVKMVKRNSDATYIKALASELKIMVHLGKHLNVVNLLGACTSNIIKKELLVIVEYCRYGNLHNYLLRHRDEFIDQIDPKTGVMDPTIGQDILERANSFNNKSRVKYAALAFNNSLSGGEGGVDYRAAGAMIPSSNSSGSDADHVSMLPTGDDDYVLSNNSTQPEWRSNYRGDYKGNVRPICTCDLICWAFQVARGMEYLASRKVLHGDLAARNILLADDNIVKICDFGLAKSMYKSDNYKKKGDGPLPVKWMAIESIRDRVFSTQSDVWSYGIVLWEFFSLAKTPYPGMEADEKLYNKLLNGYRMDQPEYATGSIHQTMLDCWHLNPNKRPSFAELTERMGNMLEESVKRHYIDLNDPYMDMNSEWMQNTQSDYLSMMSAPTYGNLVSPHEDNDYINSPLPGTGAGDTGSAAGSGYLCMGSPSTSDACVFSPHSSRSDGNVFTFDGPPQVKSRVKETELSHGAELRPMLKSLSDSESEQHTTDVDGGVSPLNGQRTYANGNISTPSFSNPAYHSIGCINPSPDNYVNMPQQKNLLRGKDHSKVILETPPNSISGQVTPEVCGQKDFPSYQKADVKHEGYVNFPNNNTATFNGLVFS